MNTPGATTKTWPDLPLEKWQETYELVHLLTQIVGKIKLQFVPFKNHWWNISFLPTVNGFTTGIIPFDKGCFEIDFDFLAHRINIKLDDGRIEFIKLKSETVSTYYDEIIEKLQKLSIPAHIWPVPVEMENRLPFPEDYHYREYNQEYIQKLQKIIVHVTRILENFRTGFSGKASPVHFFWGAFDMAVTLFTGKPAPEHPGVPNVGKKVMIEAYNAELASFGFWPGMGLGEPAFYAYAYPEPEGYKEYKIPVERAYYHPDLHEFILPYSSAIQQDNPQQTVLNFFIGAYKAAKETGHWDEKLCKY
jgi:hypothetical protein